MTQDKKRGRRITIGGGLPINKSHFQKNNIPSSRFLAFLNVDITDLDAIYEFCSNYQLIPNIDIPKGIRLPDTFKKEQRILKNLLQKFKENQITDKDLEYISQRVNKIHTRLRYLSKEELIKVNASISNKDSKNLYVKTALNSHGEELPKQIIPLTTTSDPFSLLYGYFLNNIILPNREIRTCINCGSFFMPENKQQKYCKNSINDCKRQYINKKSYAKRVSNS